MGGRGGGSSIASRAAAPSVAPAAETSLRQAYVSVTGAKRRYVRLSEVRALLGHIPRSELDGVLQQLARAKRIHLAPDDYQGSLSPAQRAAAVTFGGRKNHLILIEE